MTEVTGALLTARGLVKSFRAGRGSLSRRAPRFNAVDGVDLDIRRGETLAIVGESGCGKSTLGALLLGLTAASAGTVLFDGAHVGARQDREWRRQRARLQVIFQDAAGSLDGRLTAFAQVREALTIHGADDRDARTAAMLEAVGLGKNLWTSVPGELSGGQQQRVVIARAMVMRPDLMVCDEPVSALDVSIQAQVIELLRTLQASTGLTLLFISHDLAVVRQIADRVAVMYLGRIVEEGPVDDLFDAPRHPYTQSLIASVPVPDPARRRTATLAPGEPPSQRNPPPGCRFHPRCHHATVRCREEPPALRVFSVARPDHRAACHHAEAIAAQTGARIAAE